MIEPLQVGLAAASLLLALVAVGHMVVDRKPTLWLLGGLVLLEAGLFVQLVVGVVQLVAGDQDVVAFTFVGYLVGILLILPLGTLWALAEPTRSGTAVLVVATLVVPFLILRLEQVWTAGG
ncbi:MAG TPA: hypothetical protein VFG72_13730 [Marmoricola sp.]|nr:hypothetical protein [Marmoricola sp.]